MSSRRTRTRTSSDQGGAAAAKEPSHRNNPARRNLRPRITEVDYAVLNGAAAARTDSEPESPLPEADKYEGFFDPNAGPPLWFDRRVKDADGETVHPRLERTVMVAPLTESKRGGKAKGHGDDVLTARGRSKAILDELENSTLVDSEPSFEASLEIWEEYRAWIAEKLGHCRAALEADPSNPAARDEYANVLVAAGMFPRVVKFFQAWWATLAKGWDSVDFVRDYAFIQNCATAYVKMENQTEAWQLLESCYGQFKDSKWKPVMMLDAYFDYIQAQAAASSGSHHAALAHAESAHAKHRYVHDCLGGDSRRETAAEKALFDQVKHLDQLGGRTAWMQWLALSAAHYTDLSILLAVSLRRLGKPRESVDALAEFDVPAGAMNNRVVYERFAAFVDAGMFAEAAALGAELLIMGAEYRTRFTVPGPLQDKLDALQGNWVLGIDARVFGNLSRFINHYRGILESPNVGFVLNRFGDDPEAMYKARFLVVEALCVISQGEELAVDYGDGYTEVDAARQADATPRKAGPGYTPPNPWAGAFFTNAVIDGYDDASNVQYTVRLEELRRLDNEMGGKNGAALEHPLVEVVHLLPTAKTLDGERHPRAGKFKLVARERIAAETVIMRFSGLRKMCNLNNAYDCSASIAHFPALEELPVEADAL